MNLEMSSHSSTSDQERLNSPHPSPRSQAVSEWRTLRAARDVPWVRLDAGKIANRQRSARAGQLDGVTHGRATGRPAPCASGAARARRSPPLPSLMLPSRRSSADLLDRAWASLAWSPPASETVASDSCRAELISAESLHICFQSVSSLSNAIHESGNEPPREVLIAMSRG